MEMDENTFWVKFWQALFAAIFGIAGTVGGCTAHSNYLTVAAIEKGADPIKVQCAISSQPNSVNCALAAAATR